MADDDKKVYEKTYNSILGAIPVDKHIEMNEMYDAARIEALSVLKGKRIKDYDQGINVLADALIKFRKSSKHPNVSEDKNDRHHYTSHVREFLQQYAKEKGMDEEAVEKMFKKGKLREVLEVMMESEQQSVLESKIDHAIRDILKRDESVVKGIAEYHLEKNPHLKSALSKYKQNQLKTNYNFLLSSLTQHYKQSIENALNEYKVPDKKEDDKEAKKK